MSEDNINEEEHLESQENSDSGNGSSDGGENIIPLSGMYFLQLLTFQGQRFLKISTEFLFCQHF